MAKAKSPDRTPDLREFIKEYDQRLYDFCAYMLPTEAAAEECVLSTCREFGEQFRRGGLGLGPGATSDQMRIRLFQVAWSHIQRVLEVSFYLPVSGRDTRRLRGLDENLLSVRADRGAARSESRWEDRLALVDAQLRAPVVLRDVLKQPDEEVARILGLRWGVYRHRLHRGRLDFKEALKGVSAQWPQGRASTLGAS